MVLTPTLITYLENGLYQDRDEFLLMNDAFPRLENMYVWRGRLRRKSGLKTHGRFQRDLSAESLGNSGASPWSFNLYTLLSITGEPDASVVSGSVEITIQAAPDIVFTDQGDGTLTSPTPGNSGTINYSTGNVVLTHTAGAGVPAVVDVSYYPGLPVMGLKTREIPDLNAEDSIGFDTKYAYRYSNVSNKWGEWIPGTTWTGNDHNFFWTTNYAKSTTPTFAAANRNLFWATNFSGTGGDPIRVTDGSSWVDFTPTVQGTTLLNQCLILLPYKGRLLAFNTFEGNALGTSVQFPQRVRFSQNGDPLDQTNGWIDNVPGRGGFIDASTQEHIVSAGFVRDQLVVYFENSTWLLRYTGNEVLPFIWERINSDLGAESTFSVVNFDKGVLGVGETGIVICDATSVNRVDEQIPDQAFEFHNANNGAIRIHGIRDYYEELVFLTFPNSDQNGIFPNRVLCLNYKNGAYAIFTDSLTTFGYWQSFNDIRWQDLANVQWQQANFTWKSAELQSLFPSIIGGNQQGFTFILNEQIASDASLMIKSYNAATPGQLVSPNHNLEDNDYIVVSNCLGTLGTKLNGNVYKVLKVDSDTIALMEFDTAAGIYVDVVLDGTETYIGDGLITKRDNISALSKKFNTLDAGRQIHVGFIDFLTEVTDNGEVSCYCYTDYNNSEPINNGVDSFVNTAFSTQNSQFDTTNQDKCWHRFYIDSTGQFFQFELALSDAQMRNQDIYISNVLVSAIMLWSEPAGRLPA